MMNTAKGIALGFIAAMMFMWLCSRLQVSREQPKDTVVTTIDTGYKTVTGQGTSKPVVTKTTPGNRPGARRDTLWLPGDTVPVYVFDPSRNYDSLLMQHNELYAMFTTQREYRDQIWLDSARQSSVTIQDTIAANQLVGRGYRYNWVYPVITTTTTITKHDKPRAKVLVGGGIAGTRVDPLKLAEAEALIVGKRGGAIGLNVKYDLNTREKIYGVKKLWLISFRKSR